MGPCNRITKASTRMENHMENIAKNFTGYSEKKALFPVHHSKKRYSVNKRLFPVLSYERENKKKQCSLIVIARN